MLKNLYKSISRSKVSTLLNLLGLTAAYVAMLIILIQITSEYRFDTSYPDYKRIYRVEREASWGNYKWGWYLSRPVIEVISNSSPTIEASSYHSPASNNYNKTILKVQDRNDDNSMIDMGIIGASSSFSDMFGCRIIEGVFEHDNPKWVIIPGSIAKKHFPEESPVGKKLEVFDGHPGITGDFTYVISGVYQDFPTNSSFPNCLYVNAGNAEVNKPGSSNFYLYLTVAPNTDIAELEKQITAEVARNFPPREGKSPTLYRLVPVQELYYLQDSSISPNDLKGNHAKTNIFGMFALLVIVIAGINYINFATALVPLRIKGINTRKVFGASVSSLRWQMIAESVAISAVAYLVAVLILINFRTLDLVSFTPIQIILSDHLGMIAVFGGIALLLGIVAGLYPAFYSTSFKPAYVLKGSFGLSQKGKALRSTLVGFQYVISIGLIIASIFMNQQYSLLRDQDMGFKRESILMVRLSSTIDKNIDGFRSQLSGLSGVKEITCSSGPFFKKEYSYWSGRYHGEKIEFNNLDVSSNFLNLFEIKIIEGEMFNPSDDTRKMRSSIIFNRTAQKLYNIKVGDSVYISKVVGICEDFNAKPLHTDIAPFAFLSKGESSWNPHLYLKCVSSDYAGLVSQIRDAGKKIDPNWLDEIQFMDSRIEELYQNDARSMQLVMIFSILAIIISLVGVFGLVHFDMEFRRKEIGLRKINGATTASILTMFNRKFVWLVGVAFVIAAPLAWYGVSKWLENFAYRIDLNWWVFLIALLIVLALTIITVTVQSLKAATENPVNSIKSE